MEVPYSIHGAIYVFKIEEEEVSEISIIENHTNLPSPIEMRAAPRELGNIGMNNWNLTLITQLLILVHKTWGEFGWFEHFLFTQRIEVKAKVSY